jgi:membrane associated rhomboid family serine protease
VSILALESFNMPITYIILGVTVVISMMAFNNAELTRKLIMNPYLINNRQQYYRFVTSGFIHGDHMHLIMNMISLYFFGLAVEQTFAIHFGAMGQIYFIALYILAILVSDVTTFFKNRHNPGYNSLGASGGVSAIIFAFIIFTPLQNLYLYFALPIKGFIFGALYLIYSYYSSKRSYDNVNHDAHLWGAIFGAVFCIVLEPSALPNFIEQVSQWRPFGE